MLRKKKTEWGEILLPFERQTLMEKLEETVRKIAIEEMSRFLPGDVSLTFHLIGKSKNTIHLSCYLPVSSRAFEGSNFILISKEKFPQWKKEIPRDIRPLVQKILGLQTDLSSFFKSAT